MPDARFDVVIAGAGPGGSSAAHELARRGMNVALIDKAVFPRHKCCAGGIPVRALKAVPFDISPALERPVSRIEVTSRLRNPIVRSTEIPFVYTTTREKLDHFLLEKARKAGTHVFECTKVIRIDGTTAVTASGDFHGRILIGADGANSRVAKSIGLSRRLTGMAVECEHACPNEQSIDNTIRMDWGTIPTGYAWSFPKADRWSFGAGGIRETAKLLIPYYRKFMQLQGYADAPVRRVMGHSLPHRHLDEPVRRGQVLLVGDAAGLVDIFTGEGIYYAIRSGQIAAEAIMDGDLESYEEKVNAELMPVLAESRLLALLLDCFPQFYHFMLRVNPHVWNSMAGTLMGTVDYREMRMNIVNSEPAWRILEKTAYRLRPLRIARITSRSVGALG